MTDHYLVGGTVTWNGTGTHWATTSGGAATLTDPTASDNAFIDSGTGAGTVTVGASVTCLSLNFVSGAGSYAGTFAGNQPIAVAAGMTLSGSATYTHSGNITFSSASGVQTVTSNGATIASGIVLSGAGEFDLGDDLHTTGAVTYNNGNFVFNNHNLTAATIGGTTTNARTLTTGTGTITVTGNANNLWNFQQATGLTFANVPTVVASYAGATGTRVFANGSTAGASEAIRYNLSVTGGTDTLNIAGAIGSFNGTGSSSAITMGTTPTFYGDFTLGSGQTWNASATALTFGSTNATARNINANGVTVDSPVTFNGVGGTFNLTGNLTLGSTRTLTITNGTVVDNAHSVTVNSFAWGSGTATLTKTGAWTASGSGTAWSANTNVTNKTVTDSGTITMSSASAKTFAGGAKSWGTLIQGGAGALTVAQANTFADIKWTSGATITLPASTTTTVAAFTGPTVASCTLNSSSAGTAATLSKSGAYATISVSNLSVKDSAATGSATWYAYTGNSNANVSGNSGWLFGSPPPLGNSSFPVVFRKK